MKEAMTICSFCGCGCSMYMASEDNSITKIIPALSNPVNRGSLCIKGWHISEAYINQNRITKPLIKTNGEFKEAGYDEALNLIADKFSFYKKSQNSIGVIGSAKTTNEENYLLNRLARQALETNSIDSSFTLHYHSLLENINGLNLTIGMEDIENADFIIVIGSNLHTEAPQVIKKVLKASDKGAKIAVIGFLSVPLAEVSDYSIPINPAEISQFLQNFKDILNSPGTDKVSDDMITDIALSYKKSKNPVVIIGEDVFKSTLSKPGFKVLSEIFQGRIFPLFTINNILGAVSYGISPYADNKYLAGKWNAELPADRGLNIFEMLDASNNGSMKCMYIVGEDLLADAGDYSRVKKSLENLEFLVVQDLFMTETAKLADVILPAAGSLEKKGTFTNMEGKRQHFMPVIDPIGESKPDSEIFMELSGRLGIKLPYGDVNEITEEIKDIDLFKNKIFITGNISIPEENTGDSFPLWIKADNTRLKYHSGSLLKNSYFLEREMEPAAVLVHPDQAKANQLRNNEKVKITTKYGEILRNVLISNDIPKGSIVLRTNISDYSHTMVLPAGLLWTPGRLEKLS